MSRPRAGAAKHRGHHRRDRRGHEPVPRPGAPGPRGPACARATTSRPASAAGWPPPRRRPVAAPHHDRVGPGRGADQGQLLRRPVPRQIAPPLGPNKAAVEAALARGVWVIPILVEGAVMPTRQDLPESLAGLADRKPLLIRHESFRYDAGRLVTAIECVLAAPGTAAVSRTIGAHGVRPGNAFGEVTQKGSGLPGTMSPAPGSSPTPNASPTPSPTSPRRHLR